MKFHVINAERLGSGIFDYFVFPVDEYNEDDALEQFQIIERFTKNGGYPYTAWKYVGNIHCNAEYNGNIYRNISYSGITDQQGFNEWQPPETPFAQALANMQFKESAKQLKLHRIRKSSSKLN